MAFQLTISVRCNKILKTRTIIKTSALRNLFAANAFFPNPFGFDLDSYHKNKYVSAVNVSEIENNFTIEFSVPGFLKVDFIIDLDEKTLTVTAQNKTEESRTENNYVRKEYLQKSFSRSFILPEVIDCNGLQAKYESGILNINIHKKVEVKVENKKVIEIV
jgi:HSP20 family protein